jgi:endonuclease YncB( thermonuclease family)
VALSCTLTAWTVTGERLAVVMLDGIDINLEQVRSGTAWVYDR